MLHLFKNIFGRIWALWGLVLFVVTMLPALIFYMPCAFLQEPHRARWHRHVSQVWMYIYLHLIGCPLKVYHKNLFRKETNYIIVCNHNSLMDIPVTTPFLPNANKTIAKKTFAKVPFFGWIYSWGSVLVDRKSEKSRAKSFLEMTHVLQLGLDMVLYPEGTRNKSAQPLGKFYNGAFRLSMDTGKPMMVTLLFHTREVLPADKKFCLLPHRLELHCIEVVRPQDFDSAEAMKKYVYQVMWDYYERHL